MSDPTHFIQLRQPSLLYCYFAFADTPDYLADGLFIKHQVQVHFLEEYAKSGSPYRIIFCKVAKKDKPRFLAALEQLPRKMLIMGHEDYLQAAASSLPSRGR